MRIAHNHMSLLTIVETRLPEPPPRSRLYWRPANSTQYAPLVVCTDEESTEQLATCEAPLLFYATVKYAFHADGSVGASVTGIFRVDLMREKMSTCLELDEILPEGARVTQLLRANDAGTKLEVVVASNEPVSAGHVVRYSLRCVDLESRKSVELDQLPGLSF